MTWVDGVILGATLVSALLAFARGFVREALGIAAWGGAAYVTYLAFPYAEPRVQGWVGDVNIADPLTLGVIFIVALIAFSILAGWIARRVRYSAVGGVDRTLGLLFGLARGAALVVAAYMIGQWVVPMHRWPPVVREARAVWPACRGADWVDRQIPPEHRPKLVPCNAAARIRAADLRQATPQGYALPFRPARATPEPAMRAQESR
jgi:membrane protein required for colicin V production